MINYEHWYPSRYPLAKLSDSPIPVCDNAGNICVPIYNPKIQIYHEVPNFEGGAYPSIGIKFRIIITIGSEIFDWESPLLLESSDVPVSDVTDYFSWTSVGDTFSLDLNLGKIDSIIHQAGVSTCNLRILTCTRCLSESYGGSCNCSSTTVGREVHFGWRDKYESSMTAIAVYTDLKPEKVGATQYSYTCDIDFNLSDLTAVFRSTDPINMPPGTDCEPIPPPEPPPIYDCWGEIKATSDSIYVSASGTECLYSAAGGIGSTHFGDNLYWPPPLGSDQYTPNPTLYKDFTHFDVTPDQFLVIHGEYIDTVAKLVTLTSQNALPYVRIQDNWIYTKYYSYFWYSEGTPDIVKPDYIEVWPWIPAGTTVYEDTCTPYHQAGAPEWEVIWVDAETSEGAQNVYKKALYDVENPSKEQLAEYNDKTNLLGAAAEAVGRSMRLLSYCTRQLDDKFIGYSEDYYNSCPYAQGYYDDGEWVDPPDYTCTDILAGHLKIVNRVTFENIFQGDEFDPATGEYVEVHGDVEWYELESWPQGLHVWCSADCYEGRVNCGNTIGCPTEKPFVRTVNNRRYLCSNFDLSGRAFIDTGGWGSCIEYNGVRYQRANCYHWYGPPSRVYTDNTKIYHKFILPIASCTDTLQGTNSNRPTFYEVYADTTGTDTEVYLGEDINSTDYAGRYTVWESNTSDRAKATDTDGNTYLYVGSANDAEVVYEADTEVSQLSIVDEEFE